MDPKASAKAKRSYSQQGRRKHATPASISQKKKAAQAGSEGKVQQAQSYALPSNWDRYCDGENVAESSHGITLERGIAPKSKGADFTYLIEQARSQQYEFRGAAIPESPSLFDELTTDFVKGMSSVNALRRNNILLQCEDDHFIVDDDELTSSNEVPLLKLDMHALAVQISKIELSKRLFIEDNLLPYDQHSDYSKGTLSCFHSENPGAIDAEHNLGSLRINHRSSALKVVEADAELDLLFESFKKTSISDTIHGHIRNVKPNESINQNISNSRAPNPNQSNGGHQVCSMYTTKTLIDDPIDELLSETSSSLKAQKQLQIPDVDHHLYDAFVSVGGKKVNLNEEKVSESQSSSLSSKVMDDFDSWMDSF